MTGSRGKGASKMFQEERNVVKEGKKADEKLYLTDVGEPKKKDIVCPP